MCCNTGEFDSVAAQCQYCGGEIYRGEEYYYINAEVFCPNCLEDYARRYFAPFLVEGA